MLPRDEKVVMSMRANVTAVEQLKRLRAEMQQRTPHSKVTLADAFAFAVGSASAVVAAGTSIHDWPPRSG